MANDYAESIFQSIDTIVEKRLEGIAYDKTILCMITDTSHKSAGEYTVTDGNVTFKAYSEASYTLNSWVYVTVPLGDYNNKKIIIGKYTEEDNSSYTVVNPDKRIVKINTIEISTNTIGLKANSEIKEIECYNSSNLNLNDIDYNRLAVSARFKSELGEFEDIINLISGDFGIKINISGIKNNNEVIETLLISTEDMIGNPYYFISSNGIELQKLFDITGYNKITNISINFYQDNNFMTEGNERFINEKILDLFISNIKLYFGYDLTLYTENTLFIYTLNKLNYDTVKGEQDNKVVSLRWIESDGNRMVSHETFNSEDKFEINWYHWIFNNEINDSEAGMFWRNLKNENAPDGIILPTYDLDDIYNITVKIDPSMSEVDIRLKAIVKVLNDDNTYTYYESNIITFTNELEVAYKNAVDLISGLKLEVNDTYGGIYNIYAPTGTIINNSEAYVYRSIIASYDSLVTGYDFYDGKEEIIWKIPKNNTMIEAPTAGKEYTDGELLEDGDEYYDSLYYTIRRSIDILSEADEETSPGKTVYRNAYLKFRIKSYYSLLEQNNTIKCIMLKNAKEYKSELKISFGNAGTNGTNYTLVIEPDEDRNFIYKKKDSTLKIRVITLDGENNKIKPSSSNLTWCSNTTDNIIKISEENNWNEEKELYEYTLTVLKNIDLSNNYTPTVLYITAIVNGIELENYLPIPINLNETEENNLLYLGTDKIVYNLSGTKSSYYSNECKLYKISYDGSNTSLNSINITWKGSKESDWTYPKIKDNRIVPSDIFISDNGEDDYYIYDDLKNYWIQPIVIIQDTFENSLINSWNGDLIIDENSNAILSATIAAGKKGTDNKFTGVILGKDGSQSKIGLYGYYNGSSSFGFKEDGTAYIGKSGTGRIEFDGNNAVIKSSTWNSENKEGLYFDINEGLIEGRNAKINFTKLKTDYSDELTLYKVVDDTTSYDSKKTYYTWNSAENKYEIANITEFKENTLYYTKDENSMTDNTYKAIFSSKEISYPLNINSNFKVSWDGYLEASTGRIGGWLMDSDSLYRSTASKIIKLGSDGLHVGRYNSSGVTYTKVPYSVDDAKSRDWIEGTTYELVPGSTTLCYHIINVNGTTDSEKYECTVEYTSISGFNVDSNGNTTIETLTASSLIVANTIQGTCLYLLKGSGRVSGSDLAVVGHTHLLSISAADLNIGSIFAAGLSSGESGDDKISVFNYIYSVSGNFSADLKESNITNKNSTLIINVNAGSNSATGGRPKSYLSESYVALNYYTIAYVNEHYVKIN